MEVKQKVNNESKEERFCRIAAKRTNDVIDKIRLLSNCASKDSYSYTEEQVRKIFTAIQTELRDARAKFNGQAKRNFKL